MTFLLLKRLKLTVYTPGHPTNPHGVGPNETTPAKYTYDFKRSESSIAINGPPLSPLIWKKKMDLMR